MDSKIARINGFLSALETINSFANHGSTFGLEELPFDGDVAMAVRQRFEHADHRIELRLLDDWRIEVASSCRRWFYERDRAVVRRIGETEEVFRYLRASTTRDLVVSLMAMLDDLFEEEPEVWRATIGPRYHVVSDDFVLVGARQLCLLTLAVDD